MNAGRGIPSRVAAVDAWRGAAVAAMLAFHVAILVRHCGGRDATGALAPLGTFARTSFIFLMGVSAGLRMRRGAPFRVRRSVQIAAGAVLVTAVSRGTVTFGILHFMAVATLLLGALPLPVVVAAAAAAWAAYATHRHDVAPSYLHEVVGWGVRRSTMDSFPLGKWLWLAAAGAVVGRVVDLSALPPATGAVAAGCSAMGRRPLGIYVGHVVVFAGVAQAYLTLSSCVSKGMA